MGGGGEPKERALRSSAPFWWKARCHSVLGGVLGKLIAGAGLSMEREVLRSIPQRR